ncbi:MAG: TVP38/TMEM64 family protein [Limisphaerales bacterium]
MASFKRNILRAFLLFVFIFLAVYLVRITDARHLLRVSLIRINELGAWAPFWFIIIYIVACLTFFPGFILTMGAGILFGVPRGTFYVSIGATLGAACAFLISRYLARRWVIKRFARSTRFRAIDDAVANEGWKIVGLIRLSPVFPFIPMNFVFGLTKIPFWQFFFATWVGILPVCTLFVYLGTLLGDIAALGTQPIAAGKTKWIVSGIGIGTTLIVSLFITRIARKALAARLPDEG